MKKTINILWWLYFALFALGNLATLTSLVFDWYVIFSQVVTLLSIFCLHGYITKRTYFNKTVWKVFPIILVIWIVTRIIVFYKYPLLADSLITQIMLDLFLPDYFDSYSFVRAVLHAVSFGFMVPLLFASYRYGFMLNNKSPGNVFNPTP